MRAWLTALTARALSYAMDNDPTNCIFCSQGRFYFGQLMEEEHGCDANVSSVLKSYS